MPGSSRMTSASLPKLMLNLGLRYEYTSPLKEANGFFGNFDPTATSTGGLVQQGSARCRQYSLEARLQELLAAPGICL